MFSLLRPNGGKLPDAHHRHLANPDSGSIHLDISTLEG
jgi:hypothetical protein